MEELQQGRRLGRYQIVARLGAGGMGEVYRAHDLKLGRDVAIKVLPGRFTSDPDRLTRFKREARVLAALNHPRVAAIYELEEESDAFFLVLELVEGETLAHRIARGPLRIDRALAIALQIGEALEAAHAKGIVHRDLKPSNVMLQRAVQLDAAASGDTVALREPSDAISVKVLDFGLAKATAVLSESPTITADGTQHPVIMGTTAYMSPEQARGQAVDARTDIRSLGAVLYEMVAGRLPFAAHEAHAVLYSIIHSPHEPLTALRTDVPAELDRIVGKALSKDPGDRYQHVDDLLVYTVLTPPSAYQLRAAPVDGFGAARALSFPGDLKVVTDRTKDGRYLIVSHRPESTRPIGIWLLRTTSPTDAGEVIDFSRNSQAEVYGTLSPDERYIAYTSDIGGRVEVYVRPFPDGPGRWQVSSDGGGAPVWGPGGNELFFATATELMRARVSTTGSFSVTLPAEPLFSHIPLIVLEAPAPRYAVGPDGKRVLTVDHKSEFSEPVVRIVENWLTEFRARQSTRR